LTLRPRPQGPSRAPALLRSGSNAPQNRSRPGQSPLRPLLLMPGKLRAVLRKRRRGNTRPSRFQSRHAKMSGPSRERPERNQAPSANQLRGNTNTVALTPQSSFKNIRDVKLFPYFAYVRVLPFERKRRGAANDAQPIDLCQRVENLLAYTVAEIFLIFCRAKIDEWQHRDAFVRWQARHRVPMPVEWKRQR